MKCPFPNIAIKKSPMPYYLVVLDYGDMLRVYGFSKDGMILVGTNEEKTEKVLKEIEKNTKVEYKILIEK